MICLMGFQNLLTQYIHFGSQSLKIMFLFINIMTQYVTAPSSGDVSDVKLLHVLKTTFGQNFNGWPTDGNYGELTKKWV